MAFFSKIRLHYKGDRKQFYIYISTVQPQLCKVSDVITHWEFWKTCYNSSGESTSFSLYNLGATALSQSPSLTKGLKGARSFSPLKLLLNRARHHRLPLTQYYRKAESGKLRNNNLFKCLQQRSQFICNR